MFDIIIIGAGVVGSMIARTLSKYKLDILVLEKENDVGNGASCANSAIIHSGYDPSPGSLKAVLNVRGNYLFDKVVDILRGLYNGVGIDGLHNLSVLGIYLLAKLLCIDTCLWHAFNLFLHLLIECYVKLCILQGKGFYLLCKC